VTGAAGGFPVEGEPIQPLGHDSGIMRHRRAVGFDGIADHHDRLPIDQKPILVAPGLRAACAIEPPPR
jgi:hypothetical protein